MEIMVRLFRLSPQWPPESPFWFNPNQNSALQHGLMSVNKTSEVKKRLKSDKPTSSTSFNKCRRFTDETKEVFFCFSLQTAQLKRARFSKINRGPSGVFITRKAWPTTKYTQGLLCVEGGCCLCRPSPCHFISTNACLQQLWKIVELFGHKLLG